MQGLAEIHSIQRQNFDSLRKDQPHLAQCYSRIRRIALISCGAHESEIYFEVQLGVN